MPSYGSFAADGIVDPVSSKEAFIRGMADHSFGRFLALGGDPELAARLRQTVDRDFDAIIPHGKGPAFTHDGLHPNNVLAVDGKDGKDGKLVLSGLIDFGNARAADPCSIWRNASSARNLMHRAAPRTSWPATVP